MDYASILLRPLVSEKATFVKEAANQVVFQVAPGANKIEIKKAVEAAFSVKVDSVSVTVRKPRKRRFGRVLRRVPGMKKAYVTLAAGDKIEFFEGV
ncbi:50S ribosomal protein L23 [Desulfovibrio sulfodismutans]|jgi:large subunit ribosomal protein L23|uniref:Large ribosomal subunit protein uL23 n=1 Tax=Desulfolutivibrio sulfodismutans TaxID=63561 RepID=A0A7K3NPN8_9BACT|nr:50S ribosomal protein L23 [Desulfolutivibrio sulfodismutans]NDY58172.1 50S ribosomal protein L23 [Desulfolutivibrio sulfodismutans]QLA12042.1 50S ribosomal protein L23 [Desulfolutivibrio sulfodismutans DSM 3696]